MTRHAPGFPAPRYGPGGVTAVLRWAARGGDARAACAEARRLHARGAFAEAAQQLRAASDAAPWHAGLGLCAAGLARFGLAPFAEAAARLRVVLLLDPPPLTRRAAARALMELLWERVGPVPEAAALARMLAAGPLAWQADRLRAAALLNAAGDGDEAVEIVARLRRIAPRAVKSMAYLELVLALEARGRHGLRHAEAARRVSEALAAAAGSFERLVGEDPPGVALVAHGPAMRGARLGAVIDAHRVVIRFNNYPTTAEAVGDMGRRADIWLRAHNDHHVPLRRPDGVRLIVTSGCDIRHRFSDGVTRLSQLIALGAPVETAPTALYRALFARLQAPPSMGLLGLCWFSRATGRGVDEAQVFGYALGENAVAATRYYDRTVTGARPGRHDWRAEQAVFDAVLAGNVWTEGA